MRSIIGIIASSITGGLSPAPTLVSATVEDAAPTDIVMVFSEVVTGTNLGFTIGGTTSTAFSSISGSGTDTITGVLAVAVADGETVLLSYNDAVGDIVNGASTPLASFTNTAVTNNVGDLILDTYTAAVGYSFQKLKTGETYGFRIRRSSDNAETDVELEATGSITLSSTVSAGGDLTTWLSTDDGYITKFYDQSGNNNDLVQATQSLQAKVATAGVLEVKDSKVAALFASDKYLATALTCLQGGNDASVFALAASNTLSYNGVLWSSASGAAEDRINMSIDTSTAKIFTYWQGSTGTRQLSHASQINTTDRRLQTWIKDATDQYGWLDGSAVANGSYVGTIVNGDFQLGAQLSGSTYFAGQFQELIVMATDQTSNRTTIEANINGRY